MRSPEGSAAGWWWLARKDGRELLASRATFLVLLAIGPLTGQAFITAVRAYSEASGSAGGAAALSQGLSPLDGMVVPLFGAYALVATLLLPFIAIRMVSDEKQSGALTLLVQGERSVTVMLGIKLLVLAAAWVASMLPGIVALVLWRSYGGHLHTGETTNVLFGHAVHGLLITLVSFAAASVAESASSAAVIALAVTLGAWAIDFLASVQGGAIATLAAFTPEAMLRVHERGELDARVLLASVAAGIALFVVAATFLPPGRTWRWRARRVALTLTCLIAASTGIARIPRRHTSLDVSEDRRNSIPRADAVALSRVSGAVAVRARLGVQDPRATDLQRNVLNPISRELQLDVTTGAATATGMFEQAGTGYGEVWYEWRGRKRMSRSTTLPIVLETLYDLTGTVPPADRAPSAYPGYPLIAVPRGAAILFLVVWPVLVLLWWVARSRSSLRSSSRLE